MSRLVYMFVAIFVLGIFSGYIVGRGGFIYTQAEVDKLRLEVENIQLQEMFVSGTEIDCRLLFSSMGKLSYDLDSLVDRLRSGSPDSPEFMETKTQADLLSLRAWILARNLKKNCAQGIVPVLFFYSPDCQECQEQDIALQQAKDLHREVLVYSVDLGSGQPAIKLVRDAYGIVKAPAVILENEAFGGLSMDDLENEICREIACGNRTASE